MFILGGKLQYCISCVESVWLWLDFSFPNRSLVALVHLYRATQSWEELSQILRHMIEVGQVSGELSEDTIVGTYRSADHYHTGLSFGYITSHRSVENFGVAAATPTSPDLPNNLQGVTLH